MANKKPSVGVQLKQAKSEIERLTASLTKAEADKKSAEASKDYYSKQSSKVEEELEQLHELLDVFEGALPRRNESTYRDNRCVTRLASWLANKK